MLNFTLFETGTPERLLAGIVAGLTIGIDEGDCACRFEGFSVYAGGFFGIVVVVTVGVVRGLRGVEAMRQGYKLFGLTG